MDKLYDYGIIKVINFEDAKSDVEWMTSDMVSRDAYGVRKIDFKPNDIIIDIGANIGVFSIYLAKLYPQIKIYAFEPASVNYIHFLENIRINNVSNIEPFNLALTYDGRKVKIFTSEGLPGGSNIYRTGGKHVCDSESVILDNFIKEFDKIKLIKCDVEGSEYEIFNSFTQWDKIEYLSIEIHQSYEESLRGFNLLGLLESKMSANLNAFFAK